MPRHISAIIRFASIANNLAVARAAAPSSKVWAVVKANAYGHGIARIYPSLAEADGLRSLIYTKRLWYANWDGRKLSSLLEGFFEAVDVIALDLLTLRRQEQQ